MVAIRNLISTDKQTPFFDKQTPFFDKQLIRKIERFYDLISKRPFLISSDKKD